MPVRRYAVGDHQAVVLGEVESGDENRYLYILALVREGESKPDFFVTVERNPRSRAHEGSHRMRVITRDLDEELGSSDRWRDLDVFAAEALTVAAKVLGLDEQPNRLM